MIKTIAVRGGHNEKVRGAKGYVDEVTEDRLYYKELIFYLKAEGYNVIDVTPTSTNTKYQDLAHGVSLANKREVDLFISCHVNSSDSKGYGCEVLYCPGSAIGSKYASNISASISKLGFRNRGAKEDSRGLYELRCTKMPAVIIEPFFLDNKGDVDTYKRVGPKELARAIASAIINKEIKNEEVDEDMLPGTLRLAACKYNPIASKMIEEIKVLQGIYGLEKNGVATEELVSKLPIFKGGEERGTATIIQNILIHKGYLSNSKDRPKLGPSFTSAINKLKKDVGLPIGESLTDKNTWRKVLEY